MGLNKFYLMEWMYSNLVNISNSAFMIKTKSINLKKKLSHENIYLKNRQNWIFLNQLDEIW